MTVTLDNSSKVSGSFDATLYTSTDSTYVLEWNGKYYRVGSAGSLTIIDDPDKSNLTKSPNFSNRLKVYQQNSMVYFVDREQIYKIEVTTTTNNGTLNTESSIVVVPSNLSPTNTSNLSNLSNLSNNSVDLSAVKADLNGATVTVYTPTTSALGTQNSNIIYLAYRNNNNTDQIYSYNTTTDNIAYVGTSLPSGVAVTQAFPGTSFQVISNTDGRRYLYANGTVYEPDFQNGSLVLVPKTTTNGTNGTLGGINNISSILNTIGGGLGGLGGLNSTDLGDTLNNPVTKILTAAEVAPTELTNIKHYFQLGSSIALIIDGIRGLVLGDDDKDRTIPNPTTIGTIGSSGSDPLTPPSPTTTKASTDDTTTEPSGEIGYAIETVNPDGSVTTTKVPASDPRVQAFLKSQNNPTSSSASEPTSEQNLTGAQDSVATAPQQSSSQKTKDTRDDKTSATSNKEPKKQPIASAPVESTQKEKEKAQSIPTNPSTNKKPEQSSDGGKGTETNVNKNKKGIVDKGTLVLDMKDRENPLEVHFTLDGKKRIANKFTIEKGNIVIDAGTKVTIPLTNLSMVNLAALGDKLEDKYIVKQGDQHFTLTKPTNALSSYKLTATGSKPALVGGNKRFDIDGDGKAENTDPINLKWAMNQTSTGGGDTVNPKTENRKKEQNQITSIHTGSVPKGKYHWAYIGNKLNLVSPAGNPVDYLVEGGKIYVSGKDNKNKPVAIELTSSNYDWNIPTGVPREVQLAGGDKITLNDWKIDTEELKNGKNSGEFDGDARPGYTGVPTGITQKNVPPASGPITVASAANNLTNSLVSNPFKDGSDTSLSGRTPSGENTPQLTSIT